MSIITQVILNFFIPDINECNEGSDRCDQNCHNAVGSYACSCDSGYFLDGDGLICNGTYVMHVATCRSQ